jgi:hypothetical protein
VYLFSGAREPSKRRSHEWDATKPVCRRRRLGSVAEPEFSERAEVGFDGLVGDAEPGRSVWVGQAFGNKATGSGRNLCGSKSSDEVSGIVDSEFDAFVASRHSALVRAADSSRRIPPKPRPRPSRADLTFSH